MGRWLAKDDVVKTVAVVGGTHGNEANGVYLAKWLAKQDLSHYNYELTVISPANPEATRLNRRYKDVDLNRQFSLKALAENASGSADYEANLAQEMNARLGPKEAEVPNYDLVIDLHNTTAPCGAAVMSHHEDVYVREVVGFLQHYNDTQRCRFEPEDPIAVSAVCWKAGVDPALVPSVARSGFTFEVGAVPWGVLDPKTFFATKHLLLATLGYIHAKNEFLRRGPAEFPRITKQMTVTQSGVAACPVGYPRDSEGEIVGCVHEGVADFAELTQETAVLKTFDGCVVKFKDTAAGKDVLAKGLTRLCPLFVSEAAYVESDIAFNIAQRSDVSVDFLDPDCVRRESPPLVDSA